MQPLSEEEMSEDSQKSTEIRKCKGMPEVLPDQEGDLRGRAGEGVQEGAETGVQDKVQRQVQEGAQASVPDQAQVREKELICTMGLLLSFKNLVLGSNALRSLKRSARRLTRRSVSTSLTASVYHVLSIDRFL